MIDNKELENDATKVYKSERFSKDLVKIHEFFLTFRKEIVKITDNQRICD